MIGVAGDGNFNVLMSGLHPADEERMVLFVKGSGDELFGQSQVGDIGFGDEEASAGFFV